MFAHATDAGWVSRSHGAIAPFDIVRPATADEAVSALAAPGGQAIAGGIDVVRRMRAGDRHATLVDISGIAGLKGIAADGDAIRIGALATHWDVETDPLLAERLPAFQAAWRTIGNVRVRMAGTVGGNLMAGEAGYDGRVLLGAAGAELTFRTGQGETAVQADAAPSAFPVGALLTGIRIPVASAAALSFDRSLKPVISVAVAIAGDAARVGVGCAFAAPAFWSGPVGEIGTRLGEAFAAPLDNPFGSAAYRRRMIGTLARRQALALAGEG